MPSLLPIFEYDIFISYHHNDNRSGWLMEFVNNLNNELVYFDVDLHDDLTDTHSIER